MGDGQVNLASTGGFTWPTWVQNHLENKCDDEKVCSHHTVANFKGERAPVLMSGDHMASWCPFLKNQQQGWEFNVSSSYISGGSPRFDPWYCLIPPTALPGWLNNIAAEKQDWHEWCSLPSPGQPRVTRADSWQLYCWEVWTRATVQQTQSVAKRIAMIYVGKVHACLISWVFVRK